MDFLSVRNVIGSAFVFFEEQFLESLTAQQKKVALVAIAIFSLITTASVLAYRYYFRAKKIDPGEETPNAEKNKVDQVKVDQNKVDQNKLDQGKNDQDKVEQNKVDQDKVNQENVDQDKVDQDKVDPASKLSDEVEKVKQVVKENGLALADYPKYHDNDEIVEMAIRNHPYASQYASERLQGNAKLMELSIEGKGYSSQYATKKLREENRDLAKLAVSGTNGDGMALEFFPAFQDDDEIVELAFKQNKNAIHHASARLQAKFEKDGEVVEEEVEFAEEVKV